MDSAIPQVFLQRICATNIILMEVVSEYILEVEVLDKRHVGMKSSTMEKKALIMLWEG